MSQKEEKVPVEEVELTINTTDLAPAPPPSPTPPPPTPPPSPAAVAPANEVDKLFDESLTELKKRLADKEVNAVTLLAILRVAMEMVEATRLKGDEQKELTNRLVRQVVVDAPIADENEKLLLDMIDKKVLENTIDLVVAASKGELDVNSVQEVAKTCCLPFITKLI